MDGAKEGVILFSMGSILQSSEFPEEKLQGILKALSKLKQRVLWKYEKENLPNIPPNVKILKWLPQTDALGEFPVKYLREFLTGYLKSIQNIIRRLILCIF